VPDVLILIVSIVALIICRKVHACNVEMKRDKIYQKNKISTKDTTFTDHFCPLTNVNNEEGDAKNTARADAELSTGRRMLVGRLSADRHNKTTESQSASSLSDDESFSSAAKTRTPSSSTAVNVPGMAKAPKDAMLRIQYGVRKARLSPIARLYRVLLPILSEMMFLCLLFACSSVWPSLLSAVYMITFVLLLTRWSLTRELDTSNKLESVVKLLLLVYSALHILANYMYQFNLAQTYLPENTLLARLLGLNAVIYTKCEQPAHFYFSDSLKWQHIAYPFCLVALYWFLAFEMAYANGKGNSNEVLGELPKATKVPVIPAIVVGDTSLDQVGRIYLQFFSYIDFFCSKN
jgi:hypothetical protein